MTTEQKLERIQRYATRYEIVLEGPSGQTYLVRYGQRGKGGILRALSQEIGLAICKVAGIREDARMEYTAKPVPTFSISGGVWRIKHSGRTQRSAIIEGELPFILEQ